MDYKALVAEFIKDTKETDTHVSGRLERILAKLPEKYYSNLCAVNIETVIKPIIFALPSVKKEKTAEGYLTAWTKLKKWLLKKGDKTMDIGLESKVTGVTPPQETEPSTTETKTVQNNSENAMNQESEPSELLQNNSDIAGKNEPEPMNASAQSEASTAQLKALNKRGRKAKAENENRTQISAFLSNKIYLGVKALAFTTQQPISDIVAQVMTAFCEDNAEVVNESIIAMQHSESVKSRIKYHR